VSIMDVNERGYSDQFSALILNLCSFRQQLATSMRRVLRTHSYERLRRWRIASEIWYVHTNSYHHNLVKFANVILEQAKKFPSIAVFLPIASLVASFS
jgi:hypothetical protein